MKIILESTDTIVHVKGAPCRIWEGETAKGIKCYALIALIAHHTEDDHRRDEFAKDLQEQKIPSAQAILAFRNLP